MASTAPAQPAIEETLDRLSTDLGLSNAELARVLGVMPDELEAWRSHGAEPTGDASQRLVQLIALHRHLVDTFDSPSAIPVYLRSKLRYLGGSTPLALLLAGQINLVEGALEALDSGIFIYSGASHVTPCRMDADAALAACPVLQPWQGTAWRFHQRKYSASDHGGSLRRSGRYHRAADCFPADQTWPALYLSLDRAAYIGEVQRHLSPAFLPRLRDYRLTTLHLELVGQVVVCDEPALMGLDPEDLCHDTDWEIPRRLAAAAIAHGIEGMIVAPATRLGSNLVIFPRLLRPNSTITENSFVDPRLYVERP